jgi:flagella basal body P-ring formation protein FlgA
MKNLIVAALAVLPLARACQAIEGASIRARDMGAAFESLDPDREIAPAPLAGVERVMFRPELGRLARKYGVAGSALPPQMCFAQSVFPLREDDLQRALAASLPEGAKFHILSYSDTPVPPGTLQFTRAGLEPTGLWRGRVAYAPGRTVNTWARVRVTEQRTWVEAAEILAPSQPIREDQVVTRTGDWSLLEPLPISTLEDALGARPLRIILPGTPLRAALLRQPPDVSRGERVAVEVSQGGALLQFEAEAETSGKSGDRVFLKNPETGRSFEARVEGKGKVAIRR